MSEYGAGITLWRVDHTTINTDEAQAVVQELHRIAWAAQRHGSFDDGQADCGLGWPEDDGGYTLVATSSPAYTCDLPEDLSEAAMADDIAFAQWLSTELEALWPGRYRCEVDSQEW